MRIVISRTDVAVSETIAEATTGAEEEREEAEVAEVIAITTDVAAIEIGSATANTVDARTATKPEAQPHPSINIMTSPFNTSQAYFIRIIDFTPSFRRKHLPSPCDVTADDVIVCVRVSSQDTNCCRYCSNCSFYTYFLSIVHVSCVLIFLRP